MYLCTKSFTCYYRKEILIGFEEGKEYASNWYDVLLPEYQCNFRLLTEKEIETSWINKLIGGICGAALEQSEDEFIPTQRSAMLGMGDWDNSDNRPNDEIKQAWELSRRTFHPTPYNHNSENTVPRY